MKELNAWLADLYPSLLDHHVAIRSSYDLARNVIERDVPGDLVECGIYAGAQVAAIARAILDTGATGRKVHAFDSFQGIPAPGPEDHEFLKHGTPAGDVAYPMHLVQQNMRNWGIPEELIVYHPGWFADTMPGCGIERIALLRLDADLYESTKTCMKYLFPLVSLSGWVIVDDYHISGCRKAIHEVVLPQPCYLQVVPRPGVM